MRIPDEFRQLRHALRRGDADMLRAVVERDFPPLYDRALEMTGNAAASAGIVAHAFRTLWAHLGEAPSGVSTTTWLRYMVEGRARDYLGQRRLKMGGTPR